MRKKTVITVISIVLVIAGIILFAYPFVLKGKTRQKQEDMVKDIKQEILKNAQNKTKEPDSSLDNSHDGTEETEDNVIQEADLAGIEFEENSEAEEISKSSKTEFDDEELMGIIEIEKIDIMFAIVEGASKANLSYSICHIPKTAEIGQKGNCVLAGHRGGIHGKFFKYLNKLSEGDKVVITDIWGDEYVYEMYGESFVVNPEDTYICNPVEEYDKILTLVTCENNGKQRLVVRCKLSEEK